MEGETNLASGSLLRGQDHLTIWGRGWELCRHEHTRRCVLMDVHSELLENLVG